MTPKHNEDLKDGDTIFFYTMFDLSHLIYKTQAWSFGKHEMNYVSKTLNTVFVPSKHEDKL